MQLLVSSHSTLTPTSKYSSFYPKPHRTRSLTAPYPTCAPTTPASCPPPLSSHPNSTLTCSAGEWGAVKIYEGAEWAADLRLSFDADARGLSDCIVFLRRHRESESEHLALMSQLLQPVQRTRLLTMWSCAGLLLGEAPACMF